LPQEALEDILELNFEIEEIDSDESASNIQNKIYSKEQELLQKIKEKIYHVLEINSIEEKEKRKEKIEELSILVCMLKYYKNCLVQVKEIIHNEKLDNLKMNSMI